MKILLLSQAFYPDCVAVAQHVTDLARDLAQSGDEVTVIASRRAYDDPQKRYPAKENYENIRIVRLSLLGLGKKSKILRIIDAVFFLINTGVHVLFSPPFDAVIGVTTPPFLAVIGVLFCRLKRGRFIYWVMDLNPDEALEAGLIKKGSVMAKLLENISQFCLRESSAIIALDRFVRMRIQNKQIDPDKIVVLPPWAHDECLETIPHPQNPFRDEHHFRDKFVIMYSGNHSLIHPLDTLLEAARQLKNNPKYVFCFIGGGVGVDKVRDFKDRYLLDNIICLPYQPIEKLKYSLSAADLHVIAMGNPFVGIVHPCKIYGILAVGRPFVFIGPSDSHIGDIMSENRLGYQVEHGQTQRLIDTIQQAARMGDEEKQEIAARSRELVQKRFTRKVLSPVLASLIKAGRYNNFLKN